MKRRIQITENDIKFLVKECISNILNEKISYDDDDEIIGYDNNGNPINPSNIEKFEISADKAQRQITYDVLPNWKKSAENIQWNNRGTLSGFRKVGTDGTLYKCDFVVKCRPENSKNVLNKFCSELLHFVQEPLMKRTNKMTSLTLPKMRETPQKGVYSMSLFIVDVKAKRRDGSLTMEDDGNGYFMMNGNRFDLFSSVLVTNNKKSL